MIRSRKKNDLHPIFVLTCSFCSYCSCFSYFPVVHIDHNNIIIDEYWAIRALPVGSGASAHNFKQVHSRMRLRLQRRSELVHEI